MTKPKIIQHTGRHIRKQNKKQNITEALNSRNRQHKKAAMGSGHEVVNLSVQENRQEIYGYVGMTTGMSAMPLHILFGTIESEEDRSYLFNLRESFFMNANTVLYMLQQIEEGKRDVAHPDTIKIINDAFMKWEEQLREMRAILLGRKENDA